MDDIDGDVLCDIYGDGDAGRLRVNAAAAVDARQHTSSVDQSAGAIGNAACHAIDGRARRRTDFSGARQRRRCQPGR